MPMEKVQRDKIRRRIAGNRSGYLSTIAATRHYQSFERRFDRVQIGFRDLLRKELGSENSLKGIPTLARYMFGLMEDAARLKLPVLTLAYEIELLNDFIIAALEQRRSTKYGGECASYGETLLNCYLDLFVTLTVTKTPRDTGAKPSFLVNPATGSTLELDVLLEDFRLAFEFQGEHHYTKPEVMERDKFKLKECARFQRILIPVNSYQLSSTMLQALILNSIKDHLSIGTLLSAPEAFDPSQVTASKKQLLQFSKMAQRIHLSNILFPIALRWVDDHAASYVSTIALRSPISTTTLAPRHIAATYEMDVEHIYRRLALVTKLRRGKPSNEAHP
ncbi:hypothetical protein [Methylobacter sp.]|jgi:hypothetical protein|uniref:hypothetical protein n=1 Tax=Methylobacter sp. TaxID=2051955 RepID=UPI003DA49C23